MTAHYTHDNEESARQVPDWIKEKLQAMTAKNWKKVKEELLNEG